MSIWTKFRKGSASPPPAAGCASSPSTAHVKGEDNKQSMADLYATSSRIVLAAREELFAHAPAIDALYGMTQGTCVISINLNDKTAEWSLPSGAWIGLLPPHPDHALTYTLRAETQATLITLDAQTLQHSSSPLQLQIYRALQDTWTQFWQSLTTMVAEATNTVDHLVTQLHQLTAAQQAMAQAEVIQKAIARLPKLPASTQQLLANIQDEQNSISQLTNSVQQDPTLAGVILKHVNSAAYGLSRPISSIQHAIAYLGRNNIYQIMLQDLTHGPLPSNAAFTAVQQHSAVIALIAHELAARSPIAKACNPLTLGILHDIGQVVLLGLKASDASSSALFDSVDTAALGAELLRHWRVPEPICSVIAQQRLPEFCPPKQLPPEDRIALALLYLAHAYYGFLTDTPCVALTYLDAYSHELQLTPSTAHLFYSDVLIPALQRQPYKMPDAIRAHLTP